MQDLFESGCHLEQCVQLVPCRGLFLYGGRWLWLRNRGLLNGRGLNWYGIRYNRLMDRLRHRLKRWLRNDWLWGNRLRSGYGGCEGNLLMNGTHTIFLQGFQHCFLDEPCHFLPFGCFLLHFRVFEFIEDRFYHNGSAFSVACLFQKVIHGFLVRVSKVEHHRETNRILWLCHVFTPF